MLLKKGQTTGLSYRSDTFSSKLLHFAIQRCVKFVEDRILFVKYKQVAHGSFILHSQVLLQGSANIVQGVEWVRLIVLSLYFQNKSCQPETKLLFWAFLVHTGTVTNFWKYGRDKVLPPRSCFNFSDNGRVFVVKKCASKWALKFVDAHLHILSGL